jgi:hypothetical protein
VTIPTTILSQERQGEYSVSYTNPLSYLNPQTIGNNPARSSPSQYADAAGTSGSSTVQNQQFVGSEQGLIYDLTPQDTM